MLLALTGLTMALAAEVPQTALPTPPPVEDTASGEAPVRPSFRGDRRIATREERDLQWLRQLRTAGAVAAVAGPTLIGATYAYMNLPHRNPFGAPLKLSVGLVVVGAVSSVASVPILAHATRQGERLLDARGVRQRSGLPWLALALHGSAIAMAVGGIASNSEEPSLYVAAAGCHVAGVGVGLAGAMENARTLKQLQVQPDAQIQPGGITQIGVRGRF